MHRVNPPACPSGPHPVPGAPVIGHCRKHYDPELARALDRALAAAGVPRPGALRGRLRPGRPAQVSPALVESFVGALARLPQAEAAHLVALLEVCSFARVSLHLLAGWPGVPPSLPTLRLAHQARVQELVASKPVLLRVRLAALLRQRLPMSSCPPRGDGCEALVRGLLAWLARAHRIPARTYDEQLLQQVLQACCRSLPPVPDQALGTVTSRLLGAAALHSLLAGAGMALAYAHRERLSLTATTLLYVLLSGLFGVNLPFGTYEWVARGLGALLELPVLATSAVALTGRALSRQRQRFDQTVVGLVLCRLYQP